jgi:hypothetical protein
MLYYKLKDHYRKEAIIADMIVDEYCLGTKRSWQVFLNNGMWRQTEKHQIIRPPFKYLTLCKFYLKHKKEIDEKA